MFFSELQYINQIDINRDNIINAIHNKIDLVKIPILTKSSQITFCFKDLNNLNTYY